MLKYLSLQLIVTASTAVLMASDSFAQTQESVLALPAFDDLDQCHQYALTSARDLSSLDRQLGGVVRERDLLLSELEVALTDRDRARSGEMELSVKLGVAGVERDQCQAARLDQTDEVARLQRLLEVSDAALQEAIAAASGDDKIRVNRMIDLENEVTNLRAVVLERQADFEREWAEKEAANLALTDLRSEFSEMQAIVESYSEERLAQTVRNDALEISIHQIQSLGAQKDVELAIARSEIAALELALAEAERVIESLSQDSEADDTRENK